MRKNILGEFSVELNSHFFLVSPAPFKIHPLPQVDLCCSSVCVCGVCVCVCV
jgi:hypothetical protein